MKRFIALLLCLVMVLSLAACGGSKTADTQPADNGNQDTQEGTTFPTMTWKFGCSGGDTSTWVQAAKYFGERINEETNGAITVEYYGLDQLYGGNQVEGIQGVIDGTTDIDMHSNLIYASFNDKFSVVSLPFLFASTDDETFFKFVCYSFCS